MKNLLVIFGLTSVLFLTACDNPQEVQIATYTQPPQPPVDLNLILKKESLNREKIAEDVSKAFNNIAAHSIKVPTYSCTTYYNGNDSIDICK